MTIIEAIKSGRRFRSIHAATTYASSDGGWYTAYDPAHSPTMVSMSYEDLTAEDWELETAELVVTRHILFNALASALKKEGDYRVPTGAKMLGAPADLLDKLCKELGL